MQTISRRPAWLYPVFWLLSKWDLFFPETGQDVPAPLTISPGRNQAGEAIQVQEHGIFSKPCMPPLPLAYWWAARFPHRDIQIVLVGLAGKILGPIGFVWALAKGSLPAPFGWTILTNDMTWWPVYALCLRDMAARAGCVAAPLRGELAAAISCGRTPQPLTAAPLPATLWRAERASCNNARGDGPRFEGPVSCLSGHGIAE